MAKIIWQERPLRLLENYIDNSCAEFGRSTAMRWATEVAAFEERVKLFPTSYSPESLLRDRSRLYRRCHIMNRRFKIIHYYDESEDTVHIIDIWDTKRNPRH